MADEDMGACFRRNGVIQPGQDPRNPVSAIHGGPSCTSSAYTSHNPHKGKNADLVLQMNK